ncbi:hypothetical protein NDU88_005132 [Pleurodeles waltl]|uniref:Uncharacterized protein n=1 Tax=Pleurodeles waltl TaxID=8319 RepID=A0AAV7RLE9_PLEWA|nr:hypothetical protein NDU88_005132 [Pleurodeles waltl]
MPLLGQAPCVLAVRGRVRHLRPLWPNRDPPRSLLAIPGSSHLSLKSRAATAASSPGPSVRSRALTPLQLRPRLGRWGHGVRLLAWPRCLSQRSVSAPVPAVTAPTLKGIQGMFQSRRRVPMVARSAPTVF